MDYTDYEIVDFATDDFFVRWVLEDAPEARCFWEAYIESHPAQRDKIKRARQLVTDLRKSEQTLHTPARVKKIWQHVEDGISRNAVQKQAPRRRFPILKVAASVAILALALTAWYVVKSSEDFPYERHEATAAATGFIEEVNTTGGVIRIHLSDGSIVDLYDNSRLRYRKDHSGYPCRQVFLTGEAFFDIAENPKQPFFVYANEVVTKVIGTSFRIKAFEGDEDIVVAVKEGKVSVYSSRERKEGVDSIVSQANGVVLSPNQQVVYARMEERFVKTLIANPAVVNKSMIRPQVVFENIPVKEVFEAFQEIYGIEIIFNEKMMSNCYLTVRFASEPLFERLKIVCRTIGARYELIDAKIVVSGNGC